jgi:putative ATPase
MRPRSLDEFVGQTDLIGEGRALRRAIETGTVPSMILWGPPGTGKTTLAEIVAASSGAHFVALSAVSAGVADLRKVASSAQQLQKAGRRTVLFIDEIHRFNKAQQDAILPYVEDGTLTLIGATTENPSFEVISALLSRSRVFVLQALSGEEIATIVQRALHDAERGLGQEKIVLEPPARDALVRLSGGDARVALNTLEFAASIAPASGGVKTISAATIAEALQRRSAGYDRAGESHYDTTSAFIKTIRGSDPDAALYWLARMIDGGEDPLFIARRLVILASEDVGLADSRALQVAVAAQQAVHFVGMPEGFFALAHATLYLALAPKSNSVGRAYAAAAADAERTKDEPVPLHLRNAPTPLMEELGYGAGYRYAHDDYALIARTGDLPPPQRLQRYLPESLGERAYYEAGEQGEERKYVEWLRRRRSSASQDERDPFEA